MLYCRRVRETELFLTLLAERVYTARLSTGALRDASDFYVWLLECDEQAGQSATMHDFFDKLS